MKLSIGLKLLIFTSLIVVLVGGAISLYFTVAARRDLFRTFEMQSSAITALVSETLADDIYLLDLRSVRTHLSTVLENPLIDHIQVMDMKGVILSEGTPDDARRGQPTSDPIDKELLNSKGWISRAVGKNLEIGGPVVMIDGTPVGYLRVGFTLDEIEKAITSITTRGVAITAASLMIGVLLAFLLSRSFSRPLRRMAQVSRQIGQGKLDQRVLLKRHDEIGQLAQSVNEMASALEMRQTEAEEAARSIRQLNQELEEKVIDRTAKLENANKELIILNRNHADFTAMIAHDFRSPLGNVLGVCEMMKDGVFGPINEEQQKWIDKVSRTTNGLVSLVSDFLDVSKLESGRIELALEEVDIEKLFAASLEDFHFLALNKKIALRRNLARALPQIQGDPRRLEHVLNNLLSNALKFTPPGGEIELGASPNDGGVKLWIKDTGAGIPPDDIGQLFEKYKQTTSGKTSAYKGTGLGLVICKMIVEAHGGRIWVESEEGKGATFTLTIPVSAV